MKKLDLDLGRKVKKVRFSIKQKKDGTWTAVEHRDGVKYLHRGFNKKKDAQDFVDLIKKAVTAGKLFDLNA
jgi:hypothetical protein